MTDVTTDVDYFSGYVRLSFLKLFPTVELTSTQQRFKLLQFKARSGPRWKGMQGKVQLSFFPPLFFDQKDHRDLVMELQRRGVDVEKPDYVRFDDTENDGFADMSPAAFARKTRGIETRLLADALTRVGIDRLRLVQYNQKVEIHAFHATHWEHVVVDGETYVIDISSNVPIGDGAPGVPLVYGERAARGGSVRVQPLLGLVGARHGSVYCGTSRVAEGVDVQSLVIYPASLVHGLKMFGLADDVPPHGTIVNAAKARRDLVAFANTYCLRDGPLSLLMRSLLRFEVRCVVDGDRFNGDLFELANLVAVDSLSSAEALYHGAISLSGCFVTQDEYVAELRAMIDRIENPKFRVGFKNSDKELVSINAVVLRLCDFIAQLGIFPNGFDRYNCVGSALTWTTLNPTHAQVLRAGDIWSVGQIDEPDAPEPPPKPVERSRRAFTLPIDGEPTDRTKQSIVRALLDNKRLEAMGQQPEPIRIVRTLPTGPIARLFSDQIARNWDVIEETPSEEQLTAEEILRMQMDVMLRITEGRWQRQQVRRYGQIGVTAKSRSELLDIMMRDHANDWLEFDLNSDYSEFAIKSRASQQRAQKRRKRSQQRKSKRRSTE
jgi:hypothetical protein